MKKRDKKRGDENDNGKLLIYASRPGKIKIV